jgi:hypothetical protein
MVAPSAGELLQALADGLPDLMAADVLEVETQRSVRDRMSGRPGRVVRVRLLGPELTLTLSAPDGGRPVAEAAHVVRGVTISRRVVPLTEWLDLLAGQVRALTFSGATDEVAVGRMLAALGVRPPGSDLVVDPADVRTGLQTLAAKLTGVPDDVTATVERVCALLLQTLPRVEGDDPLQAHAVLRTATDYLPRTLREYVALPQEWAENHQMDDGKTALDVLRDQLSVLESAVTGMRDAAVEADAKGLLANGLFLKDRFGASDLS